MGRSSFELRHYQVGWFFHPVVSTRSASKKRQNKGKQTSSFYKTGGNKSFSTTSYILIVNSRHLAQRYRNRFGPHANGLCGAIRNLSPAIWNFEKWSRVRLHVGRNLLSRPVGKTNQRVQSPSPFSFGQSCAALLSLFLRYNFSSSTAFGIALASVSIVQEFFQGASTTLLFLCLSLYSDRKVDVYHFTLLCTVGSLGRLMWTYLWSYCADLVGWTSVFMLPICLYIGVFMISIKLARNSSFWSTFYERKTTR